MGLAERCEVTLAMEALARSASAPASGGQALLPHAAFLGRALLAFAVLDDADLARFEAAAPDLLVRTPAGEVWICPAPPTVEDGKPWVTARSMRELGRSFAEAAASGGPLPRDEGVGEDAAANDFGDEPVFDV